MIGHRKALTCVMCIVMGVFSAGCYTVNAVHLSEPQTFAGNDLFAETTRDGRLVRYQKGDLDSLQISGTTVARFSKGRMISRTPIDSIRSIETRSLSWSRTIGAIGMTAAATTVGVFIILATQRSHMKTD